MNRTEAAAIVKEINRWMSLTAVSRATTTGTWEVLASANRTDGPFVVLNTFGRACAWVTQHTYDIYDGKINAMWQEA